ncbi:MAG: hypothetical protein R2727_01080 [Bacteroidales bacterium]
MITKIRVSGFLGHSSSKLKEWLNNKENRNAYSEMFVWWAPEYWQKTIRAAAITENILNQQHTPGQERATGMLPGQPQSRIPAIMMLYLYRQDGGNRMMRFGRGGENSKPKATITSFTMTTARRLPLNMNQREGATWNHLRSYYLSPGSATVSLSKPVGGAAVAADAIRWVKQINNRK